MGLVRTNEMSTGYLARMLLSARWKASITCMNTLTETRIC